MAQPWTPPNYISKPKPNSWTPPDYLNTAPTPEPIQEPNVEESNPVKAQPEQSLLGKAWDWGNKPITTLPSWLTSKLAEPMIQYGESDNGIGHKAALYGGQWLDTMGKFADEFTSPINAALMATTGGASAVRNAAIEAATSGADIAKVVNLAKVAKTLEVPGRVAGAGMIGHGGYRAMTGEDIPEKLSGVAEMLLGGMSHPWDSSIGKFPNRPKVDVSPVDNQLKFPLPRGTGEPEPTGPFFNGPAGTTEAGQTYRGTLGNLSPETAALQGTGIGGPTRIQQYMDDIRSGKISKDVRLLDYLDGKTTPVESKPNLPVLEGEILPSENVPNESIVPSETALTAAPTQSVESTPNYPQMPEFSRVNPTGLSAKYRFFQPDPTDPSGGFHMYDIVGGPSNGSTVSAEKLNELGIEVPPTPSSVPQRPTWNPPNYVKPGLKSMEDSFLEKGEPTPKPVGEGDYVPGGVYDKSGRLVAPPQPKFPERPDGPWNQSNGPEFARSEQGGIKVGVNVKRAADEVTTGYNAPLEAIMVREGMQNALDAVEHLGDKGQVRVEYPSDKEIKISDNGKGMTRKEIETVFSNLHETGKANQEGATGGKGIGKASYMLGGDYFTVSTVAENIFGNGKKTKITVEGTPNEFMEHVPVEEEPVSPNTPTGTTISVKLKEKHSIYTARNMFDNIVKHSRGKGSQIVENRYRERNFPIESGINDTLIGEKTFTDGGTNDVKIGIPKGVELGDRRSINLQVLNNGMYQYTEYGFYTGDSVPNMPEELVVDIHPHAQEGTTEYPFGPNRESIKDKLKSEIFKYVKDTLVDPAKTKQANRLQELYDSMQDFPTTRTKRKAVMFDPGDRLTPAEKEEFQTSPIINSVIELIDKVVDDSLKAIKRPAVAERLEGVGIALSSEEPGQGYYGIHIPHPKAEKSTLLINFLLHVANNKNPADAALGTIFTTLHEDAHIEPVSPGRYYNTSLALSEKSHPKLGKFFEGLMEHGASSGGTTPGHGTDWMNRLGEIYAQYGPTRTFDAAEKLHKILTDNTGGYSPEVQKLLSIYQESRGRDPVTEDILSGTGVKQESTTGGKGNVPPNDKPNGTRTITESINRLKAALETGKLNREEQNTLYSSERSKRAAKLAGVKKPGLEGYYQKLGILKGELPKIPTNTELDDTDVDNLINSIDGSSLRPFEKVTASTALIKLLAGKTPQEGEIKLLTGVFGQDIGNLVNMYSGLGGFRLPKNLVNNLVNLPKSVKSAFDLSAALRQGLPMIDRKEYWKAFYDMHKFFGSKKFFDATMEGIKDDPAYEEATESGLFLAEIGQDLTKREEQFLNSWITYIPGFSGSERAYVGFLNEVRFGVYKSLMEDSKRIGKKVNPEELSKFINIFTGRGGLGKYGERVAVPLNAFLWSPRNISSKFTMLNPAYYVKASPFVRKEALRALIAVASAGLTSLALYKMAGASVSTDSTSSDFGKAKFGNTRVDPWGGLQQNVVTGVRIGTYIKNAALLLQGKSIPKGEMYRPGTGYNTRTAHDVAIDFMENKESPAVGFASSMLNLGKSFEPSGVAGLLPSSRTSNVPGSSMFPSLSGDNNRLSKQIINLYTPMVIDDLVSIAQDDPKLLPLGLSSLYGQSVNTYSSKPRSPFRTRLAPPAPSAP